MNQHLSNVLHRDLLAKDYPPCFEVCLKNSFKNECWAWDISHIDMDDFVKSMPPVFWEAKWIGTNKKLRRTQSGKRGVRRTSFVGITNINKECSAWLPVGKDTYLSIEEYLSKKLHLTKLDR